MLKDIRITTKFPLIMISLALISAIATGVIAYVKTTESIQEAAQDKLVALLESRKSSVDQYFNRIGHKISFHAQSPLVIEALKDFASAWEGLPQDKTAYLQSHYIERNPFKVGQKSSLLIAQDGSLYSQRHKKYHPTFKNMIEARTYCDFFLLDPKGNLVYSVKKEADFATNVIDGIWHDTHLAQVFNGINSQPKPGQLIYADFSFYLPGGNEPASFIGSSVYDEQQQYLGVVIYQMPIEPLDNIMQVTAGMGDSGETYLVGQDFLMRSNSRFLTNRSILNTRVDSSSVKLALQGTSGMNIIDDYRDVEVLSAFAAIDFLGTRWAMLAEIDLAEVMEPAHTLSNFLLISGVLIAIIICLLGYLLANDISQPIVAMTRMMNQLSNNDLKINISVDDRKDEVGSMAKALVVFKQNAVERDRLHNELRYVVEHDTLTGLYTRKYALDQLPLLMNVAKQASSRLVLMFIDIDDFKHINDTYGHAVGDRVLNEMTQNLTECVRKNDVVARVGGDEFLILLPDINSLEDSHQIAKSIISSVQVLLPISGANIKLTLSLGISVYPDDGEDISLLLSLADKAMYSVKGRGKNSYAYWNEAHLGSV
ncbi:MAG: diguanylate cyclase [Paraglaciecola sp.]|nr:diguanylate cyclase [Paraglaciecola sp.]